MQQPLEAQGFLAVPLELGLDFLDPSELGTTFHFQHFLVIGLDFVLEIHDLLLELGNNGALRNLAAELSRLLWNGNEAGVAIGVAGVELGLFMLICGD